jgi:hypothetical protein
MNHKLANEQLWQSVALEGFKAKATLCNENRYFLKYCTAEIVGTKAQRVC